MAYNADSRPTAEADETQKVEETQKADRLSVLDEKNGQAEEGHGLHRGLQARHITMIAIGGAIGTGLIIGTGATLAKAGPGALLIAYLFVGLIVSMVMFALGEMATWLPLGEGFAGYASRFVDPALGFALGWSYFFKYLCLTPNQLTAAAMVLSYWVPREKINPGVFVSIFLVTITLINYFGIRFFGEFEFWLSSFKIVVLIGLIMLSLILACGGGPDHEPKGFKYWKDPGAFKPYAGIKDESLGKFVSFWSTMVSSVFAYLGTELIGVTVGEAENPRRNVPRAIKLTFWRILIFYCLSVFFLGMIIPYNSKELAFAVKNSNSAAASPFVAAIKAAGIQGLPAVLNACILMFIFSAANSDLYIGSRTIYGLAVQGKAPKIFATTDKRGVPYVALGICVCFCGLAFMTVANDSAKVFTYFVNMVSIFGLLSWISILVSHIFFVKARRAQGITETSMAYVAPQGIIGSTIALVFCCIIAVTKNFTAFLLKKPDGTLDTVKFTEEFVTGYIGIPIYLLMLFGYKWKNKTKRVRPAEADFYSGKAQVDREEEEFLARQALIDHSLDGKWKKLYSKTVGILF